MEELTLRKRRDSHYRPGRMAQLLLLPGLAAAALLLLETQTSWLQPRLEQFGLPGWTRWLLLVVGGVIVFLSFASATFVSELNKMKNQTLRDAEIGVRGLFVLYLRPFFSDIRVGMPNPFYNPLAFGLTLETSGLTPEEFIGRVLEPYIDVRQVGGGPRAVGPARVYVSNEKWQEAVTAAVAEAASIIILLLVRHDPKDGSIKGLATMWELKHLVESGAMGRTIVIIPPSLFYNYNEMQADWEGASRIGEEFGIKLPEYHKNGGVVLFEKRGPSWQPSRIFGQTGQEYTGLAEGLLQAIQLQAAQHGFALLDRR
jgi:hypothetical protein